MQHIVKNDRINLNIIEVEMLKESEVFIERWKSQVKKGTLEFIVLLLLKRKRLYGYELIKQIEREAGIRVAEGTLYPLLKRLGQDGLVLEEWRNLDSGKPRKYYFMTSKGKTLTSKMVSEWKSLSNVIQIVSSPVAA